MFNRRSILMTLAAAGMSAACARQVPVSRAATDSIPVGYGAQPKEKLTGAVTSVSDAESTPRPMGLEELLRGRIPGLVISGTGGTLTLRLRGTSSILLKEEALVIVDDVMIQSGNIANALAGLTPDDIRQVSVLRDVASTSIYGSRGAGGVILIRTKAKPPL